MKTVVKAGWVVACIAVVSLIGVPTSWAAKIARVDMNKVVQEYQKAKDMQMQMEKEFMDKKAVLKIMSDQLDKQQAELTTKKGIVSQQEYDGLKSKFDAGRNAFQEKYNELKNMFLKKQEDAQESILSDIKAVVAQIAKAERYDAVFDKEVMLYGGEDITYKVLDQLNKKQ